MGYKQIHTFGAQLSIKFWDSLTLPDFEHRRCEFNLQRLEAELSTEGVNMFVAHGVASKRQTVGTHPYI
jgi:hypothetical protein